ncbi:MAG TPA: restriction endonuclease [Clostridiales bacterium]|nr:restriction endonuclease [Clostridiales bacterium]
MKFDVIIGNPPYQLSIGSSGLASASAVAIYHLFIDKAIELDPKYITMITPSRWMTRSAAGVSNEWIDKIITSNKIKEIHDFFNSEDCFNNVTIRGGVNYFLWDNQHNDKCIFHQRDKSGVIKKHEGYLSNNDSNVVIRDIVALNIINKVIDIEGNYLSDNSKNFSYLVSPTGLFVKGSLLAGSWKDFSIELDKEHTVKYYTSKFLNGYEFGWIKDSDIQRNRDSRYLHKVYIAASGGNEKFGKVLPYPRYSEPGSVCSGSYLIIGYDASKHFFSKEECLNIITYIKTNFFRFLIDAKKSTQHCSRAVYQFVPLQDFSKPWTDYELYKKYKLTVDQISYIDNNIFPME